MDEQEKEIEEIKEKFCFQDAVQHPFYQEERKCGE